MDLPVRTALFMNVLSDHFLVTVLTHGIRVISTRPELATPEHLLDFGMTAEDLLCSNALDGLNDGRRRHHGNALDEKMDMVCSSAPISTRMDLVSFSYSHAHLFERHLHFFRKGPF